MAVNGTNSTNIGAGSTIGHSQRTSRILNAGDTILAFFWMKQKLTKNKLGKGGKEGKEEEERKVDTKAKASMRKGWKKRG